MTKKAAPVKGRSEKTENIVHIHRRHVEKAKHTLLYSQTMYGRTLPLLLAWLLTRYPNLFFGDVMGEGKII